MSVDLYQPCPGGLDKKIKFCCRDLAHDLEKISRLVKADQDKAALDYVDRLIEKYPDRQCILAWHARLKIALTPPEEARSAVEAFLRVAPDNPMAHCSLAVVEVRTMSAEDYEADENKSLEGPVTASCRRAIESLQRTVEAIQKTVPGHLPSALILVGRRLVMEGYPVAGREHLGAANLLGGANFPDLASQDLVATFRSTEYSLLLKDDITLPRPPGHVAWRADYMAAANDATRIRWRAALRRLREIDARYPNQQIVYMAMAKLHMALAENKEAATRLRAFARLNGVAESDAVYAEALALVLDPISDVPMSQIVRLTFPVRDVDRVAELLSTNKRVYPHADDPSEYVDADETPPAGLYIVCDQDMAEHDAEPTVADLREQLGELFLFREDDKDGARLEVDATDGAALDSIMEVIRACSEAMETTPTDRDVLANLPANVAFLTRRWYMWPLSDRNVAEELFAQRLRKSILEEWPDQPQALLDGKTVREAAPDPAYRTRVLALILMVEGAGLTLSLEEFDELYRRLGLPIPQPRSIFMDDLARSPAVRLARVDPAPLSDAALEAAYRRAVLVRAYSAMQRFGLEIIRRGSLQGKRVAADGIYAELAQYAERWRDQLHWLAHAQEEARKAGRSPVPYLLNELGVRLDWQQPDRERQQAIDDLIARIRRHHSDEPGVERALQNVIERRLPRFRNRERRSTGITRSEPDSVSATDLSHSGAEESGADTSAAAPSKLWLPGQS